MLSPYSLTGPSNHPGEFYADLADFTDSLLLKAEDGLGRYVDDFMHFVRKCELEELRSEGEYILEMLMIGIFWKNYSGKSDSFSSFSSSLLRHLYKMRKQFPKQKDRIDKARGILAFTFLENGDKGAVANYSVGQFKQLLRWMESTGEFSQEASRLQCWVRFLKTRNSEYTERLIHSAVFFADFFEEEGRKQLGCYVGNWSHFQSDRINQYRYKEDYFFVSRKENEYFLNMVGAEIMNRGLRAEFDKTPQKAAILPTCMRTEPEGGCKAISDGLEKVCLACNKNCNIGKVAIQLKNEGVKTYIIPHSSDFSKFLVKWKDRGDISLIGVACVLNLLGGGYEMRKLNISSQCVFLDYCGCKKHWDPNGLPTNLNSQQLADLLHTGTSIPQVA